MAPLNSKNIKSLSDLVRDIMRLDGLDLSSVDREIISAINVIANRYDDVYAPELNEIREILEEILDKFEINLLAVQMLTKKVKELPDHGYCIMQGGQINEMVRAELSSITLPKLFIQFIKKGKWNLFFLIISIFLLAPYLQFIVVTLFAFIVEKAFGVNLFEIWPFLKHVIGQ